MLKLITQSVRQTLLWTLVAGVVYPLAITLIAQLAFKDQANGSLVLGPDGKMVGSRLIAQPFTKDEYFQPRPSAASYNGAASGATNWSASNYQLRARVAGMLVPIVKYRG